MDCGLGLPAISHSLTLESARRKLARDNAAWVSYEDYDKLKADNDTA
jgi:hypothetical protein